MRLINWIWIGFDLILIDYWFDLIIYYLFLVLIIIYYMYFVFIFLYLYLFKRGDQKTLKIKDFLEQKGQKNTKKYILCSKIEI